VWNSSKSTDAVHSIRDTPVLKAAVFYLEPQKPTLFELNAVDPMQIDTIGHIIDFNTK
jgi:hypothetical protein